MSQEEMERIAAAGSGQLMQLTQMSLQAAEVSMIMRQQRLARATVDDRGRAAQVASRLRADRDLAALVWARSADPNWVATADPEAVIEAWVSARTWAPYEDQALAAADRLAPRMSELGIDVDAAGTAVESRDAQQLRDILGTARTESPGAEAAHDSPVPGEEDRLSDREREAVRDALDVEWGPEVVEALTGDTASWPRLEAQLAVLQRDPAQDLIATLRAIDPQQLVGGDVRHPAGLASWKIKGLTAQPAAQPAHHSHTKPAAKSASKKAHRPTTAKSPGRGRTTTRSERERG